MEWNSDSLFKKLSGVSDELQADTSIHQLESTIKKEKDEKDYLFMKDAYERLLSGLSESYLSMSDWYVGPTLTRELYDIHFKHKKETGSPHYLHSKKDVLEFYGICIFFSMIEASFPKHITL
jgi:hypothetical protein